MPNADRPASPGERTKLSRLFERLLLPLDRVFNKIYSSRYNPLYRSGTLAAGLLTVVLVTGLYLLFFYRVSAPYESVVSIQSQTWLGRWIRALHRYTSDAAVLAVGVHIVRLVAQGKTWGPRLLAWLTGVLLAVLLFVSGWTGYVMVWDRFGQELATTGARMLSAVPLFPDSVERSFSGVSAMPGSFFFMNLFLHVAIPLGMIIGLWIHTSKIARTAWFPVKRLFAAAITSLFLLSVIIPAPLGEKADLLTLPGRFPVDGFFGGWLPAAWVSPAGALAAWFGLTLLLSAVPWLVRPRRERRPKPSFNDPKICQGCNQCVSDCPYEAISMVPRTEGKGSTEVARVDPDACVSCGVCAASCSSFTIGPPGRKAPEQMKAVQSFIDSQEESDSRTLVVTCRNQPAFYERVKEFCREESGFALYPVDCPGSMHAAAIDRLARRFRQVAVVSCPPRNCTNREGTELLGERLTGERKPTLTKRGFEKAVVVFSGGDGEEKLLFSRLRALRDRSPADHPGGTAPVYALRTLVTAGILGAIAACSAIPFGQEPESAVLRLSWRLRGQAIESCRDRTPGELEALPRHMRTARVCTREPLPYRLSVVVDGEVLAETTVHPEGVSGDSPVYVNREFRLEPGEHGVKIGFRPAARGVDATELTLNETVSVSSGQIALISLTGGHDNLSIRKGVDKP